ncbi:hypothetical protein C1646_770245 [Rhizophagus diaphanus]|nr:hypothetical protein C1646_770245 [Rhizophagus diaphanus] [Rhizophagus sp. MUCL 43196]
MSRLGLIGGLGETTYEGEEFSGIDLNSSPPMTGKTSLGQLLEDKLLKIDEVQNGSACVLCKDMQS